MSSEQSRHSKLDMYMMGYDPEEHYKIHRNDNLFGEGKGGWLFHCPGCETSHCVSDSWGFNGDEQSPTFTPSILTKWFKYEEYEGWERDIGADGRYPGNPGKDMVCHSFVTKGNIQFLSDCTHSLAGKTVPLPDWTNE